MTAMYNEISHTSPVVITRAQARQQTKTEELENVDNELMDECIEAAIDEAESYIQSNIRERKFAIKCSQWIDNFEFREQIMQSVDSITYLDEAGNSQTLVVNDVLELTKVDKYSKQIVFKDFDALPKVKANTPTAITINVTCGYPVGKTPKGLIQGIKLLISDNYDFRGDRETKFQTTSRKKLEPYKYYRKT